MERLKEVIRAKGGLSEVQFGFWKGQTIMDAIFRVMNLVEKAASGAWQTRRIPAVVLLDVRNNAFNALLFGCAMDELTRNPYLVRIINDYFRNREVLKC